MAATDRVTPISGLLITMLQSSTIFKLIAMYDFISRCILGIYTVNRKKGSTVISFIASRNISQFK